MHPVAYLLKIAPMASTEMISTQKPFVLLLMQFLFQSEGRKLVSVAPEAHAIATITRVSRWLNYSVTTCFVGSLGSADTDTI